MARLLLTIRGSYLVIWLELSANNCLREKTVCVVDIGNSPSPKTVVCGGIDTPHINLLELLPQLAMWYS